AGRGKFDEHGVGVIVAGVIDGAADHLVADGMDHVVNRHLDDLRRRRRAQQQRPHEDAGVETWLAASPPRFPAMDQPSVHGCGVAADAAPWRAATARCKVSAAANRGGDASARATFAAASSVLLSRKSRRARMRYASAEGC